jgi:NADH-quinone oxidoreductase subunit L
MIAQYVITSFIIIPLVGFLLSLIPGKRNEGILSRIAFLTAIVQSIAVIGFIIYWLFEGSSTINVKEFVLYRSKEYEFYIDFYFDHITAVFLFTGGVISLLVIRFSKYYMHLENGYKRFFNTVLFFYFGYNWVVLSGNFETLFIGWEFIGIASFLLIAFYRERYLPVRNAVRVFSIYRIGDIGILSAMWASHHLWHENIAFIMLNDRELVLDQLAQNSDLSIFISICILIAAAAKSAQLPFSSWLPRAMEGPTPSSAIFYGSLSVHFGVFLLLRTFPLWESINIIRILVIFLGLSTAIVAFFITRVQTTIKTQIAYASITQIGIIFIEIGLGLHVLALIHFIGNAFLRTYQLLVSPSVVSYLIRDQIYHFTPVKKIRKSRLYSKIEATIYILSIQEWKLDSFMSNCVFRPLKQLGKQLNFLTPKNIFLFFLPLYFIGVIIYLMDAELPFNIRGYLPEIFAFLGLVMVLKAFSERHFPRMAWLLVLFNHFCIALAVSFNELYDYSENIIYLTGISIAGIIGIYCIHRLRQKEKAGSDLNQYNGLISKYPKTGTILFLCTLALMGFPITPSFIGVDLIISHIHEDQFLLGLFISMSFIFGGIALIRIYARLFLGANSNPTKSNPTISS